MAFKRLILILIALGLSLLPACGGSATISRRQSLGPEGGPVKSLVFAPGYARNKTVFAYTQIGVFQSGDAAQSWTKMAVGPDHEGVLSVALSPNYGADKTIFATTPGGHFRSGDGGRTWKLIRKYEDPYDEVSPQIFVSPDYAEDHTIFLAGIGLYKSTDKGRTWKAAPVSYVADMVFSPNYTEDKTILAIYQQGEGPDVHLYRSTDRGRTWTEAGQRALGDPYWGSFATFSPDYAKDMTVFFGQAEFPTDLFMSTDGGGNWAKAAVGEVGRPAFSPQYRSDQTVFAGGEAGLFKSTDGGRSWEQTEAGRKLTKIVSIAVAPDDKQQKVVYVVRRRQGVYRSTDGGKTWRRLSKALKNAGVTAVYPSPSYSTDKTLLAATLDGVYKSIDGGRSWETSNSGLTGIQIGSVALSPNFAVDKTIFAGSLTRLYKSTDRGHKLRRIKNFVEAGDFSSPQVVVSPDYANDRTVFLAAASGVHKSTNAGLSWTRLTRSRSIDYPPSIAVSPNYAADRTIFTSSGISYQTSGPMVLWSNYFLKSTNGGATWRKIKLTVGGHNFVPEIIRISPAWTTDKTVIASDTRYIFKSTDSGRTFRRIDRGLESILRGRNISDILFSPNYINDRIVILIDYDGRTLKSTNAGNSWKRLKWDWQALAFSPDYAEDKTLFAAGDEKLFRSTDGGATWVPLKTHLYEGPSIVPSPDYSDDKTIFVAPDKGAIMTYTFAN